MRKYLFIGFLAAAVPMAAQASVRINEIAWMGTDESASAEWMELSNDDNQPVDLSGWILNAADGSPSITFPDGAHIDAQGYFLLERTRDTTVPSVPADLIYTGSLSNSGETLTLTDAASTTVDVVVGGDGWCAVGGDNATKQTAQRTGSGWITATATPRAANAATGTTASCDKATDQATGSKGASTSTSTTTATDSTAAAVATTTAPATSAGSGGGGGPPTYEPVPPVFLSIGPDRTVVAGADTKFQALVSDGQGHRYAAATVHWAFGDGSSADSTNVFKSYRAPGTYLVTAAAIQGLGSGADDLTVTVKDAAVRVITVSPQGITIANDSASRLDLSFWRLRAGTTTYALPEGTKVLPHVTVLFPKDITNLPFTHDSALLYPNGKIAAGYRVVKDVAAALPTTPRVQPAVPTEGFNPIQVGAPVVHNSANHISAYDENTAVAAPAASAKTEVAGALYAEHASATASRLIAATSTATSPGTVLFPFQSFFSSPLTITLVGVLLASGTVLVLL
ncbi:MAG TPA: lamin tail domain-containing protein [Candidatus Paceibacterota bacterium]|nr:lamin tail domain-containing protein [Candidatus Paceibacterota bacterium]